MTLTDILPFDGHSLLSRPRRHNCLHKYISLSPDDPDMFIVIVGAQVFFFLILKDSEFRVDRFQSGDNLSEPISRFSYSVGVYDVVRREFDPGFGCDIDDFSFCVLAEDSGMLEMRIKGQKAIF